MNLPQQTLKAYLHRLTNLSTRNKSLLLSNLSMEQFVDWQSLDFVSDKSAFELLEEVIEQKKNVKICQLLDSRSEKVNEVSKRLNRIARTEQFIKDERGSEDLYVGYPFVRGKLIDGTPIHAPLVFFPVTLQLNDKAEWTLQRRAENASLNRSFLLAYSHFNAVKLTDELLETNLDELSRDALQFRTELYELLKNSPVELNFNQDMFQNKLQFFDGQSKADLDLLERNGELKLYPEAVLGIFPQGGSYLAPDYERLITPSQPPPVRGGDNVFSPSLKERGLGGEVVLTPSQPPPVRGGAEVSESKTFTAFAQDASQEQALQRIKSGESLVVQGPPGTGKSQLIANLMADFAARGKRVLLVCQKRVALDVVHNRLTQVGISPFIALIHDFKNDRAALYQQLDRQIEQVENYEKENYSLDSIILDRQFVQISRTIEQNTNELETYRTALYNDKDCGLSAKELYLTSNPNATHIAILEFRFFQFDDNLSAFLQKLNRFAQYQTLLPPTHLWHERVSFDKMGFGEINQIEATITAIPAHTQNALESLNATFSSTQFENLEQILGINRQADAIENWLQQIDNEQVWSLLKRNANTVESKKSFQVYNQVAQKIKALEKADIVGNEVKADEIGTTKQRLEALITARQSFWTWLFYKDKSYFKTLLAHYNLTLTINDLYQFEALLSKREEWQELIEKIEETFEVEIIANSFDTMQSQWQSFQRDVQKSQEIYSQIDANWEFLNVLIQQEKSLGAFRQKVEFILQAAQQTNYQFKSWKKYLTDNQILKSQNTEFGESLKTSLRQDFDVLVETDRLKNEFSPTEMEIVNKLLQQVEVTDKTCLFQNSLRLAWLAYLEEKYPILRAVSSLKINQLEQELQEAIQTKQTLSKAILLMQLREQTYKNLEYNRLQNRVSYRDLKHQVTKKRKIWAVRKLMEHHAEEVFKLVPCWMASPETVSAVFPLTEGIFDLVIFDEASQCYAEYGIPAIYRGKQTVVVGDSKQLAPYDLYRVRYEADNEEDNPQLEVESLLDLAKQFLPETSLMGHYRSKSLDLIDFSNKHFYRSKLHLLPDFSEMNDHIPTIKYIKVEGVWEKNENIIEAEKVKELVAQLHQMFPEKSIGIVTFNHHQQRLIDYLLHENTTQNRSFWWAKNIENVQGDECDIIVFSVGYAPDFRGKMRVQFGSLNLQSGENRLNVAITRAREQVYVVTSILPHQLQVEDTLHQGPKLLKAYLQYALDVSEGNYLPSPNITENDRIGQLKNALKVADNQQNKNERLVEELPFADLTVKNKDQYIRLLLTDDVLYQQAISAKEIHAYLPLQMRQKGWQYERIWSRNWWRSQKVE